MLGEGILKGLAETAKNFAGSFVSKERLTTVEYPEERLPLPEAARNFPFLVYDGEDWEKGLRCVACQICEKECPPKCIYIEKSKDKKPDFVGKPQIYPAKFDIDISVCMSCQICVEVCPFEAIKMNTEFELATDDRFGGLLLDRRELAKSNTYYHQIHPTEASEVDARLAEEKAKAEAKAKADAAKAKAAAEAKAAGGAAAGPAPSAKAAVPAGAESAAKPVAAAKAEVPVAKPTSTPAAAPGDSTEKGTPTPTTQASAPRTDVPVKTAAGGGTKESTATQESRAPEPVSGAGTPPVAKPDGKKEGGA